MFTSLIISLAPPCRDCSENSKGFSKYRDIYILKWRKCIGYTFFPISHSPNSTSKIEVIEVSLTIIQRTRVDIYFLNGSKILGFTNLFLAVYEHSTLLRSFLHLTSQLKISDWLLSFSNTDRLTSWCDCADALSKFRVAVDSDVHVHQRSPTL